MKPVIPYETILSSMREAVYVRDLERRLLFMNRSAELLTGWNFEEVAERPCWEVFGDPGGECEGCCPAEDVLRTDEATIRADGFLKTRSGEALPVRCSIAPVLEEGERTGVIVVMEDISERLREEKLKLVQRDLATELNSISDSKEALNCVLEAAFRMEGVDSGGVYIVDGLTGELDLVASKGLSAEFVERVSHFDGDSTQSQIVRRGEPVCVKHPETILRLDEIRKKEGLRGMAVIPVKYKDRVVAVLNLASHVEDEIPTETRDAIEAISAQIGGVMARIMAEEELKKTSRKFYTLAEEQRLLLESVSDFIYRHDAKGVFYYLSPTVEKVTGYTVEEWRKHYTTYLTENPNNQHVVEATEKTLKTGEKHPPYQVEIRHKDGSTITLEVNEQPIFEEGVVVGIVCVARDITARVKAERALADSEEEHRMILDQMQEAVIFADADGIVRHMNTFASRLLGTDRQGAIGNDVVALHPPPIRKKIVDMIEDFKKNPDREAVVLQRSYGNQELIIRFSPARSSKGKYGGIIANLIDVTETKRLERQLLQAQKMESLGTLAGGFAHDFNNHLNVILGFASLILLKRGKNDPEYESLLAIKEQSEKAARLARQLLTLSRGATYEKRRLDVNALVRELCDVLRSTFHKNIRIAERLSPDLWPLAADADQFHQALMNLCINARDAMPEGGVLTIESFNETLGPTEASRFLNAEPGKYVCLTVSDSGEGIDEATRARIFDPFFTTKEVGKGTGLGLSVTRRIVLDHGGFIQVYSRKNQGTTFKVYLPSSSGEKGREAAASLSADKLPRGTGTVLVIDDEESNRKLAVAVLSSHGYRVLTAGDGVEGLKVFREKREKIDLVIADMVMPRMSGEEVCRTIRRENATLPIILCSGYNQKGVPENLASSLVSFLSKPFVAESLLFAVDQALRVGGSLSRGDDSSNGPADKS